MNIESLKLMPRDPDAFLSEARELHRQMSDLIVERNTQRMNARVWFCAFCFISVLWVLREVAR